MKVLRFFLEVFSQWRAASIPHLPFKTMPRLYCSAAQVTSNTNEVSSIPPPPTPAPAAKEPNEELVPEKLYHMVNIKVESFEFAVLESYIKYVRTAAKALGINIGGRVALPTRIQKFTVLKSPHIFKKHRVQYEIRTHARLVQIKQITGTTADVFLEYIQRNLPEGVSMTVYQEQLKKLPTLLMEPIEIKKPAHLTKIKKTDDK